MLSNVRPLDIFTALSYFTRENTVPTRLNIELSDDLQCAIDTAASRSGASTAEVFRKSLQLYLSALEGSRSGLVVGLIDPTTGEVKQEIIGL